MSYKDKNKQRQYLKNYHKLNRELYHDKLGTTDIDEHMAVDNDGNPDWDKEIEEINQEYKRLHLKRKL